MPSGTPPRRAQDMVIPVLDERAEVVKRPVERGRVQVRIEVDERQEAVRAALRQEDASVERVLVGRVVTDRPAVREEAGVLIVPVVEERLVVRTELVLKEELRITRRERVEQVSVPVRLRSERVEVARSEGNGPEIPTVGEEPASG